MQKKIRKLIPKTIRRKLGKLLFPKSPVEWANFGPISLWLANKFPSEKPPVIILSLPRSGSSWVGEILGSSPTSMYLHEPLTQTLVSKYGKGNHPVIFEVDQKNLPDTYNTSLNNVIEGLPVFTREIIRYPEQWTLKGRKNKKVIAKEVNPLMANWIVDCARVQIIYLLRHPVPIVSSFKRLGWTKGSFERCFTSETLQQVIPN